MRYQDINAGTIDNWCQNGWEWGVPITHEQYLQALRGEWKVYLTPTRAVPHDWFGEMKGKKILGLASGGGQLRAGFCLTHLYEDTNGSGNLHERNIPCFLATRALRPV